MKKHLFTAVILLATCGIINAQTPTTLGVGINPPYGTLHVHSDTIIISGGDTNAPGPIGGGPRDSEFHHSISNIHLTNALTGTSLGHGFVIECNDHVTTLMQKEDADLIMKNHNAKIVLSANGKVGIGAVNNSYLFNVNGTARITSNLSIGGAINCSGNGVFSGTLRAGSGFFCAADGALKVKSLRVTTTDWPDYVFGGSHRLMPLSEVEGYIQVHGHLPEVPSAEKAEAEGVDLGEMNRLLLQKVEELTLYVIDLQKQLDELNCGRQSEGAKPDK